MWIEGLFKWANANQGVVAIGIFLLATLAEPIIFDAVKRLQLWLSAREAKRLAFWIRLGDACKEVWIQNDSPGALHFKYSSFCRSRFLLPRGISVSSLGQERRLGVVDPSLDISITNRLKDDILLCELGIEILSVMPESANVLGRNLAGYDTPLDYSSSLKMATRVRQQAAYEIQILDCSDLQSNSNGVMGFFWRLRIVNSRLSARIGDLYSIPPSGHFRCEVLLRGYVGNAPRSSVIRVWVATPYRRNYSPPFLIEY